MMKKILLITILIPVIVTGCGGRDIKDTQPRMFDLFIEQAGNRIDIKDNTAEIRRIPFSIIINFSRPDSIFINASFSSESFNNAQAGLPLSELVGFRNPGIDEEPFNRQNTLYISNDTPNLWYYTDDTDHRFNLIKKHEKGIICQRNIFSVSDISSDTGETELSRLKNSIVYLVLVTVDWNEDYTKMIERNRKLIKLKFIL